MTLGFKLDLLVLNCLPNTKLCFFKRTIKDYFPNPILFFLMTNLLVFFENSKIKFCLKLINGRILKFVFFNKKLAILIIKILKTLNKTLIFFII